MQVDLTIHTKKVTPALAIAANVHRLSAVLVFRVPAAWLQLLIKDRKLKAYSKADPKIVSWGCS